MKKIILSVTVIIAFVGYSFYDRTLQNSSLASLSTGNQTGASTQNNNQPIATPSTPAISGRYDDEYDDEEGGFKPNSSSGGTPAPGSSSAPSVSSSAAAGNGGSAQSGKYKDGTYVGPVTDAYFGNIQVKTVISGGKITDVIFLQYPSDRSTSRYINSQAMPILKSEAISSQSANVDIVSGATQSSLAFRSSLSSALSAAIN